MTNMTKNKMANLTKGNKNFFEQMNTTEVEIDVQEIYRFAIRTSLDNLTLNSPERSDGFLRTTYPRDYDKKIIFNNMTAVLEFKNDMDFINSRENVIAVIMQSMYYIKKYEKNHNEIIRVIFGGTRNSCFCISANVFRKYLINEEYDWNITPSDAYDKNEKLRRELDDDRDWNVYQYATDKDFKFSDVLLKMFEINNDDVTKIKITPRNIPQAFKDFSRDVLKTSTRRKLDQFPQINIYANILSLPEKDCISEDGSYLLTDIPGFEKIDTKQNGIDKYRNIYQINYNKGEIKELTGACDKLIEDINRRKLGAFFTPKLWTDEGHKRIGRVLGDDWKDKYVVWDCCSGTGNLTRDYTFKELYCSTIIPEELNIAKQNNKQKAEYFLYDFTGKTPKSKEEAINSSSDNINRYDITTNIKIPSSQKSLLPSELIKAFENNAKILILMNPPYAAPGGSQKGKGKSDLSESAVKERMKEDNITGKAANQLFTQFLYKILMFKKKYNLTNLVIATYAPLLFLTGAAFESFRKEFLNHFEYKSGIMFPASQFDDLTAEWPISFTVWKSIKTDKI